MELSSYTCAAITRAGKPCPIYTGGAEFCHVHDPALQCGAIKKNGKPCTMPTGGRGRCRTHLHSEEVGVPERPRTVGEAMENLMEPKAPRSPNRRVRRRSAEVDRLMGKEVPSAGIPNRYAGSLCCECREPMVVNAPITKFGENRWGHITCYQQSAGVSKEIDRLLGR